MMKENRLMAMPYILIAIVLGITPFIGILSNPLIWLAALIFLGLRIFQLMKTFKK